MALSLDGTTGISGVDGSNSSPAIQGADPNTGFTFGTDIVNIITGGVNRGQFTANGRLSLTQNIIFPSKDAYIYSYNGGSDGQVRSGFELSGSNQHMRFFTATNERMRIDSSGRVGLGKTDPDYHLDISDNTAQVGIRVRQQTNNTANTYSNMILRHATATSGQNAYGILFQNSGGTEVGKIDYGQSTTQYRTSSDYRLKENVVTISDGITRLKTLKPYRFNWIAEKGQPKVDGFFAHEVTAVPEAISGTKDEVDTDNNPIYQGIDQSKLVPLLTAALQEAVAKIEVLETKVAALEGA